MIKTLTAAAHQAVTRTAATWRGHWSPKARRRTRHNLHLHVPPQ